MVYCDSNPMSYAQNEYSIVNTPSAFYYCIHNLQHRAFVLLGLSITCTATMELNSLLRRANKMRSSSV